MANQGAQMSLGNRANHGLYFPLQNESGKYEYRYLFVELEGYPRRTIVLEDRR